MTVIGYFTCELPLAESASSRSAAGAIFDDRVAHFSMIVNILVCPTINLNKRATPPSPAGASGPAPQTQHEESTGAHHS